MGVDDNYVTGYRKIKLVNYGTNSETKIYLDCYQTDAASIYQVKMGSDDNYVTDDEKIKLLDHPDKLW